MLSLLHNVAWTTPADHQLFSVSKVCIGEKYSIYGDSTVIVHCNSEFLLVEHLVATVPNSSSQSYDQPSYKYFAVCCLLQPVRMEDDRRNRLFPHVLSSMTKRVCPIHKMSKPLVYAKSEENIVTIINHKGFF